MIYSKKITISNFKKYGEVITLNNAKNKLSINKGWTDRYNKISEYYSSDNSMPIYSIFRGYKRPHPLKIDMLEMHPLSSQAFFPITKGNWLIVVCETINNMPNIDKIECFYDDQSIGINYFPSVWHHPLIVLNDVQDFLVIDRDGENDKNYENTVETEFDKMVISY